MLRMKEGTLPYILQLSGNYKQMNKMKKETEENNFEKMPMHLQAMDIQIKTALFDIFPR